MQGIDWKKFGSQLLAAVIVAALTVVGNYFAASTPKVEVQVKGDAGTAAVARVK